VNEAGHESGMDVLRVLMSDVVFNICKYAVEFSSSLPPIKNQPLKIRKKVSLFQFLDTT